MSNNKDCEDKKSTIPSNTPQSDASKQPPKQQSEPLKKEESVESADVINKKKKSLLRLVAHLLPGCMLDRTDLCKHDFGCFENVLRQALRNFLFGFGLSLTISNIGSIAKPAKLLKNL